MRAAADGAANGAGLRCPRSALVRLLWRGCASRARQRQAAGAHERRPAGQGNGAEAAAEQRDDCGGPRYRVREAAPGAGKHRRWSAGLTVWDTIV